MGLISITLPTVGSPNSTEDVNVRTALQTIQTAINGGLDTTNLSASAAIANSQLAAGGSGTTLVSTLPTTGLVNGQIAYYQSAAMATAGLVWTFRYNTSEATYKWEFIGGNPLISRVDTAESTSSATYVALTTAHTLALPALAGDWDIGVSADVLANQSANAATSVSAFYSYKVAAVTADDLDAVRVRSINAAAFDQVGVTAGPVWTRKTALAASTTLTANAAVTGTGTISGTFSRRILFATPIRVI